MRAHIKIRERGRRGKRKTRKEEGEGEEGKYLVSREYFTRNLTHFGFTSDGKIYNPMVSNLNLITRHESTTRNGASNGLKTECGMVGKRACGKCCWNAGVQGVNKSKQ